LGDYHTRLTNCKFLCSLCSNLSRNQITFLLYSHSLAFIWILSDLSHLFWKGILLLFICSLYLFLLCLLYLKNKKINSSLCVKSWWIFLVQMVVITYMINFGSCIFIFIVSNSDLILSFHTQKERERERERIK
jgi:hypothetical protein